MLLLCSTIFYLIIKIQLTAAYSIYAYVGRSEETINGSPTVYLYVEEVIGNRDCRYKNVEASYYKNNFNFTEGTCTPNMYPPLAAVYENRSYPKYLSYVVSKYEDALFFCSPLGEYTKNDSMEYNCFQKTHPPISNPIFFSSTKKSEDNKLETVPIVVFMILVGLVLFLVYWRARYQ